MDTGQFITLCIALWVAMGVAGYARVRADAVRHSDETLPGSIDSLEYQVADSLGHHRS